MELRGPLIRFRVFCFKEVIFKVLIITAADSTLKYFVVVWVFFVCFFFNIFFQRKSGMTFHVNCLPSRQLT